MHAHIRAVCSRKAVVMRMAYSIRHAGEQAGMQAEAYAWQS